MKASFYSCTVHTVPLALWKNEMINHCSILKTTNQHIPVIPVMFPTIKVEESPNGRSIKITNHTLEIL